MVLGRVSAESAVVNGSELPGFVFILDYQAILTPVATNWHLTS